MDNFWWKIEPYEEYHIKDWIYAYVGKNKFSIIDKSVGTVVTMTITSKDKINIIDWWGWGD